MESCGCMWIELENMANPLFIDPNPLEAPSMKLYLQMFLPFWAVIKLFELYILIGHQLMITAHKTNHIKGIPTLHFSCCVQTKVFEKVGFKLNFVAKSEFRIMGNNSPLPLLSFDSNSSLWSKVLEAQAKRRVKVKKQRRHGIGRCRRPRSIILMKRRRGREINPIEKKVKTLKKLIPNKEESMGGLDGLFKETADYILSLQMRVKVMQIMVELLTSTSNE